MRLLLTINYVSYTNYKKKQYQEEAMGILADLAPYWVRLVSLNYEDDSVIIPDRFEVRKVLKRNSREVIGNNRDMPYIKDIFDYCAEQDQDIFGYLNSDIAVYKEFFDVFKIETDAYLFNRTDVSSITQPVFRVIWNEHPGYDGFFFRKNWWLENGDKFNPDLILGEPFWDYYYPKIIDQNTRNVIRQRSLYHTYHDTDWDVKSVGALNNRKIYEAIK